MAKVLTLLTTIRNNWKKSVLGIAAFSYGISYGKQTYDTEQLMRQCCENVAKYGDSSCPTNIRPRHVTVVLNPAAKKRKAKKLFQKYCEPLLHLAGISVTIIDTQSGSHARNVIMNLEVPTDAIIVGGGDGTLSDVITGLMRKYKNSLHSVRQCPIGILPLGSRNTIASIFYREYTDLTDIHHMIDATMAIIKNNFKSIDAIEIKLLKDDPDNPIKPIYAVDGIEWGAWSDTHARIDKYWYWGPLRKYAAYLFNGYKSNLNWKCNALMKYTNPCKGCSCCYSKNSYNQSSNLNKRWWHAFLPKRQIFTLDNPVDYSKVINVDCGIFHEMPISTTELCIKTDNINVPVQSTPSLKITLGPENISYATFVEKGWKKEINNELPINSVLDAKTIELHPETNGDRMFYIDHEEYELKPIQIRLLPQSITIFYPELNN
ncbi:acylglycerol kinase, mitochondrial isoform X1 [Pogonomyrmex barbatus]|uniref:Acylglycerol kinase, mitochondrial n=2 Tax=Pogonomyrmex barbatus TaxID=144034 RepID=A0A6I9W918_9HYME|nr:acylglycerol kinase, mitochondrial isoform X1 [Pogonomyrmex barbatus]